MLSVQFKVLNFSLSGEEDEDDDDGKLAYFFKHNIYKMVVSQFCLCCSPSHS